MFFHSKRSDNTKNSSSSMKLDVRLKNKILHCFKRRHCEKLCCERTSQFYICVYIQCGRRRLTDCILISFFPPKVMFSFAVFSQSTDVVVVNFVVALKFPINVSPDFEQKVIFFLIPACVFCRSPSISRNFKFSSKQEIEGYHLILRIPSPTRPRFE